MGQVVGQTNSKSEFPLHDPVTPQDLVATVYRHLGIDPSRTFLDFSGRPVPLLSTGRPSRARLTLLLVPLPSGFRSAVTRQPANDPPMRAHSIQRR